MAPVHVSYKAQWPSIKFNWQDLRDDEKKPDLNLMICILLFHILPIFSYKLSDYHIEVPT